MCGLPWALPEVSDSGLLHYKGAITDTAAKDVTRGGGKVGPFPNRQAASSFRSSPYSSRIRSSILRDEREVLKIPGEPRT